jgi:hypothetical protein
MTAPVFTDTTDIFAIERDAEVMVGGRKYRILGNLRERRFGLRLPSIASAGWFTLALAKMHRYRPPTPATRSSHSILIAAKSSGTFRQWLVIHTTALVVLFPRALTALKDKGPILTLALP